MSIWECLCVCGNKTNVSYSNLVSGNTKSCGCFNIKLIRLRAKEKIQNIINKGVKFCPLCKKTKKLSKFYKNNKRKDGIRSLCIKCCTKNGKSIQAKMRTSIITVLKRQKARKNSSTMKLIGCDLEYLKTHLQETAMLNSYKDFNINNYSGKEYHIDHIIPCSKWNLKCSYHQKLCFNYTNLQILTAKENLEKGDRIVNVNTMDD